MGAKVYGHAYSGATLRVLSALHEKGLEFEFVPIDLFAGDHKTEAFLSLNPFGQVPVFQDNDFTLFESRAITQYLAHAYADQGNELVFKETKKMAEASVWVEVEAQKFDPPASKLGFELLLKSKFGLGEADKDIVEEKKAALGKVLNVYEARLAKSSYLGGESFGLADLHHQPTVHYLMDTPAKALFESLPNVSRWADDILARPAWGKAVSIKNTP